MYLRLNFDPLNTYFVFLNQIRQLFIFVYQKYLNPIFLGLSVQIENSQCLLCMVEKNVINENINNF